jgi:hypothetical protein
MIWVDFLLIARVSHQDHGKGSRRSPRPDRGYRVRLADGVGDRAGHHAARNIQLPLGCRTEFDLSGGRQVLRYLEDLVAV